jgi:dihydroxy-acid dehydratase
MEKRRATWRPPAPRYERGYGRMYLDHIRQAHQGCDFDFLRGTQSPETRDPLKRFRNPAQ